MRGICSTLASACVGCAAGCSAWPRGRGGGRATGRHPVAAHCAGAPLFRCWASAARQAGGCVLRSSTAASRRELSPRMPAAPTVTRGAASRAVMGQPNRDPGAAPPWHAPPLAAKTLTGRTPGGVPSPGAAAASDRGRASARHPGAANAPAPGSCAGCAPYKAARTRRAGALQHPPAWRLSIAALDSDPRQLRPRHHAAPRRRWTGPRPARRLRRTARRRGQQRQRKQRRQGRQQGAQQGQRRRQQVQGQRRRPHGVDGGPLPFRALQLCVVLRGPCAPPAAERGPLMPAACMRRACARGRSALRMQGRRRCARRKLVVGDPAVPNPLP